METQIAVVDRGEMSATVKGAHRTQKTVHLFSAENYGKAVFPFGMNERKKTPVPMKDILEEEFDDAIADAHGTGRKTIDILPVKKVVLKFLLIANVRSSKYYQRGEDDSRRTARTC
jgi:hypothetical protein